MFVNFVPDPALDRQADDDDDDDDDVVVVVVVVDDEEGGNRAATTPLVPASNRDAALETSRTNLRMAINSPYR